MSPTRVSRTPTPSATRGTGGCPGSPARAGWCIFGVTGDLARKKLMPADLRPGQPRAAAAGLRARRLRPPRLGRPGLRQGRLRRGARSTRGRRSARSVWSNLAEGFRFVPGTFDDAGGVRPAGRDGARAGGGARDRRQPRVLPVDPAGLVLRRCASSSSAPAWPTPSGDAWRRVVIEKPFGHDLVSARELNDIVEGVFPPDSVFRIDHYLGKETVQNLLALRFANQMFEPIWNANYVDHVQITMAEDIGIGGRAGYYDGIGAARDVIQNHLLQLLALTAMEEPVSFDAERPAGREGEGALRRPAARATSAKATARGQYAAGWQGGEEVIGYLEEEGVAAGSHDRDVRRAEARDRHRAAGPGCRSTCAPASGSAGGSPRSPSCSSGRRTCRSPTPPPRSWARTPSSSACSPTRASPCASASKVPGRADGGARRDDGLRLRARVHRVQPRGVRAAHPRRAARRPAAVPPPRGGRAVLADPRPGRGLLGQAADQARPLPVRRLGPGQCRRDDAAATAASWKDRRDRRPAQHLDRRDQQEAGPAAPGHRGDGPGAGADPGHRRRRARRGGGHPGRQRREPPAPVPDHRRRHRQPPRARRGSTPRSASAGTPGRARWSWPASTGRSPSTAGRW